jgi:trehalose-phosphatase
MIESHIVVVAGAPPRHRPGTGAHTEGALAGVAGTWVALEGGDGIVDDFDIPVVGAAIDPDLLAAHHRYVAETLRPLGTDAVESPLVDPGTWRRHREAIEGLAEAAAASIDPAGLTIVTGDDVALVGGAVRGRRPNARIATVLEAPIPPVEVLARLPWRREFLEGVLAADVVFVSSHRSAANLAVAASRFAEAIVGDGVLAMPGRRVRVVVNPPAIDAGFVAELADQPHIADRAAELRSRLGGPRHVLLVAERRPHGGTAGRLLQRALDAFAQQECAPQTAVLRLVLDGDGSGELVTVADAPVPTFVIQGPMPMEQRIETLLAADAVVSIPPGDDRSPVPREYAASRTGETGAVIVSELTAAAEDLDGAFIVNPWDPEAVADVLGGALTAPPSLLADRMELMRAWTLENDTGAWVEAVVAALAEIGRAGDHRHRRATDDLEADLRRLRHRSSSGGLHDALGAYEEIDTIVRGRMPIVLLDFDGTLSPIVGHPADAALPDRERALVTELAAVAPVAVVSGRDLDDVREKVGIDGLWFAGSHGLDIMDPEGIRPDDGPAAEFAHFADDLDQAEQGLRRRLEGSDPGVVIERKRFTIAVHYRLAPHERVPVMAAVAEMAEKRSWLRVTTGKAVVELRPAVEWDKGAAVRWLVARLGDGDAVPVYIGDDLTDEPAFRTVRDGGVGVFVGRGRHGTAAGYRLDTRDAVADFLERLLRTITSG